MGVHDVRYSKRRTRDNMTNGDTPGPVGVRGEAATLASAGACEVVQRLGHKVRRVE